ncbi:MAG: type 1 glutamine amidotransferase [Bacillota bacterium]|nr:type 1 glutamine amidotransferase [Bacillota bacterium]
MIVAFTCYYHPKGPEHAACARQGCKEKGRGDCSFLNYRDAIEKAGLVQSLPRYVDDFTSMDDKELNRSCMDIACMCSGLILTGGGDISWESAYEKEDYKQNSDMIKYISVERDRLERALFSAFCKVGKPVLGICRGMQVINCLCGGTIYADIGAARNIHHPGTGSGEDKLHAISLRPGCWLCQAGLPLSTTVNSHHHQAVKTLGNGLTIDATSPDGLIEGFSDESRKLYAMQWHPERIGQTLAEKEEESMEIFAHFARIARGN